MKNVLSLFRYLPALAGLVTAVEGAFGPKNGASKKKAVIDAFTAIITTAAPFVETANPAYAAIVEEAVDFTVKQLNAWANLSAPVVTPEPVPVPVAVPNDDPYAHDLDAYPDPKKLKAGDIVWQKPNGKWYVQPSGVGISIPADWRQIEVIGG